MKKRTLYAAMSVILLTVPALTGCSSNVIKVSSQDMSVNVKTTSTYEGYLNNGPIFTGTVQANEEITVVPKVSGRIANIPVEVGMNVKAGDVLFTLEDEDLKNSTLQSEAAVGAAQLGIDAATSSYKNGIMAAENGLNQAKSTVDQLNNSLEDIAASETKAKQSLTDAQNSYNRTKELFNAGAVSKSQLEQAETALVSAETAVKSVEVNRKTTLDKLSAANVSLKNAKTQLDIAKTNPQVSVSEQQLKQAEAAAQIANHTLKEATISSPITGIIGKVNGDKGEIVTPQAPVVVVSDLSKVRILVYIPATEINRIKVGNPVQVNTVAADFSSMGTVKSISPIDDKGKGYPVEVMVTNTQLKLKPGMISEVTIINGKQTDGIIIPKSALVEKDNKQFVFTIEKDQAKLTEVEVSEETDSQALVVHGLHVNDKVATTNVDVLEDKMKIVEEN